METPQTVQEDAAARRAKQAEFEKVITHLERCIAVMNEINLHPHSYSLPENQLTLLRNAIFNTPYHYPAPEQIAKARKILTRNRNAQT